eukprot:CAMPEP_0171079786 /NCGR_PEP_ID=MMETSP0766_2-20121228/15471_1 /TAXON_ID=439317 /ORGANISM="Gambierdiscus australes, Strain CAWD 149" /LENGTH=159 /DNA_ID=CAMNT_0011536997 /DNA_START=17 /DNA_END=494 /DNA_ORIENTATION=-
MKDPNSSSSSVPQCESTRPPPLQVCDIAEGRMGCQGAALQLPARNGRFPLCDRQCVMVVGGENGEEDLDGNEAGVRQFSSALVYDTKENEWWPEGTFPDMLVPRTAMAVAWAMAVSVVIHICSVRAHAEAVEADVRCRGRSLPAHAHVHPTTTTTTTTT